MGYKQHKEQATRNKASRGTARAVQADQPSYRSERDPAGETDAAQEPKGLRGPAATNAPRRKAGEGLRGSEARPCARA